jgi:hypothetical protein
MRASSRVHRRFGRGSLGLTRSSDKLSTATWTAQAPQCRNRYPGTAQFKLPVSRQAYRKEGRRRGAGQAREIFRLPQYESLAPRSQRPRHTPYPGATLCRRVLRRTNSARCFPLAGRRAVFILDDGIGKEKAPARGARAGWRSHPSRRFRNNISARAQQRFLRPPCTSVSQRLAAAPRAAGTIAASGPPGALDGELPLNPGCT